MDQSQMLAMLTNIYEKLVADVAARVIATTAEVSSERISELAAQVFEEREAARPGIVSDAEIAEMRVVAIAVFEEMIEPALEEYDPSDVVDQAVENLDLESNIDDKIEERLEAALESFDIEDKVTAAVRELHFEIKVR